VLCREVTCPMRGCIASTKDAQRCGKYPKEFDMRFRVVAKVTNAWTGRQRSRRWQLALPHSPGQDCDARDGAGDLRLTEVYGHCVVKGLGIQVLQ